MDSGVALDVFCETLRRLSAETEEVIRARYATDPKGSWGRWASVAVWDANDLKIDEPVRTSARRVAVKAVAPYAGPVSWAAEGGGHRNPRPVAPAVLSADVWFAHVAIG